MMIEGPDPHAAQLVDLLRWHAGREAEIAKALLVKADKAVHGGERLKLQAAKHQRLSQVWQQRAEKGR